MTIHIILEDNGYDGLSHPSDYCYSSEKVADEECKRLNTKNGNKIDSYYVHSMEVLN